MSRETKKYDDDDGRVICNMDVEGMPWHDKRVRREKAAERKAARQQAKAQRQAAQFSMTQYGQGEQMTRTETLRYTFYAVLAGLAIVLVFSLTWVLFILFCTQVWFK